MIVLKRGVPFPLDLKGIANRVRGRALGGMYVLRECQAHLPQISFLVFKGLSSIHIR